MSDLLITLLPYLLGAGALGVLAFIIGPSIKGGMLKKEAADLLTQDTKQTKEAEQKIVKVDQSVAVADAKIEENKEKLEELNKTDSHQPTREELKDFFNAIEQKKD